MGKIAAPGRAKLVIGLIFREQDVLKKTVSLLTRRFGPIDGESELIPFGHTSYYSKEMGMDLKRKFFSFQRPVSAEGIFRIKVLTNRLEERLAIVGERTVNIDPGYLTLSNLVLLTTKNYTHRIYLGGGIYAETTLFYKDGSYRSWDWTYPDYKTREYIAFFNNVREAYIKRSGTKAHRR